MCESALDTWCRLWLC